MNQKEKELMLKLADFLKTIPRNKFDMGAWMINKNFDGAAFKAIKHVKDPGLTDKLIVRPLNCKTSGCAIGWATTMPEFKRRGLKLIAGSENAFDAGVYLVKNNQIVEKQFKAVGIIFGISEGEAWELFRLRETKSKNTPKAVAKRLRKFVKTRE